MEHLTIEALGYQATAFEKDGFINFDSFKANEIMEVLDDLDDDAIIDLYNDYLSENYEEEYYKNDDDFINESFTDPADAVKAALYGNYNYYDDYVRFDGYNNLKSCNGSYIRDEAENNEDFKIWLYDNYNKYDDVGEFIIFMNDNEEDIKKYALELVRKGC